MFRMIFHNSRGKKIEKSLILTPETVDLKLIFDFVSVIFI